MKDPLYSIYFLDGVYLAGGTPFVEWVEHLGVVGTLGSLAVGWGASVEMIGSVVFPTVLSLSLVAGGVTLTIGVTGNIYSTFIWLKESEVRESNFSFKDPWLSFSLQLEMRRLRPGFDHCSSPSQYGIVWKSHTIGIRLCCWLIHNSSFPNISTHFLNKNRLSRVQFHVGSCGSVGLPPKQFSNSRGFHVLTNS